MSQQDEGLKTCPFCGTAPKIDGVLHTKIWCPNDQCIIWPGSGAVPYNDFGHREAAIAAWNRRAPEHEKAAPMAEAVAQCNCGMGTASGQYHHDKCPRFNQFPDRRSPAQEPDYWLRAYHLSRQLSDHLLASPASHPPASAEQRERLARIKERVLADIDALCAEVMGEPTG